MGMKASTELENKYFEQYMSSTHCYTELKHSAFELCLPGLLFLKPF